MRLRGCDAAERQPERDVVAHGFPRQQRVLLEHVGRAAVEAGERLAVDAHRAPDGASRPATMFRSVDLPQPLGPTSDTNCPAATWNVMFSTAV